MRRNVARSAMPLAAAVLLGVMPLAAQETGADTAAKNAQGYAPNTGASVGSLASTDPWVRGGAIALPGRSAAEVDQAVRASDQQLAGADSELTNATARQARTQELIQARQRQIAELEVKKKEADKEKRKADKKALESQQKVLERRKELAVQLKDVNAAEIAAAGKAREAAIARQQALGAGAHAGAEAVGAGEPPPDRSRGRGADFPGDSRARAADPRGAKEGGGCRQGPGWETGFRREQATGPLQGLRRRQGPG